mmetsp:Transcript_6975/g.30671  ORF Transcript_6975/g.30671 Transcript_6975/m.30671 type:complete len:98 (+) Transcript_6975:281-574(+)
MGAAAAGFIAGACCAASVRASEADLASLRGRDMTVTRAVPDIQKGLRKREHRSDVRGALASVGATARVRGGVPRGGFGGFESTERVAGKSREDSRGR